MIPELTRLYYPRIAIQAARMNAFSPIIATSSPKHTAFLKSLGATHVLDRNFSPEAILSEITKITVDIPLQYVYDAVSDKTTQCMAYDALASGGGLVSVFPNSEALLADCVREGDGKRVVRPFSSLRLPANHALGLEVYKRMTGWLEDGTIVVSVLFQTKY